MAADLIAVMAAVGLAFGAAIGVVVNAADDRELIDHIARGAELGGIGGTVVGLVLALVDVVLKAG